MASEALPEMTPPALFSVAERRQLLALARRSVEEAVLHGRLPPVNEGEMPARLCEPRACFVTLKKAGRLRGCIGQLKADAPLYRAVMFNARSAALYDSRFPPVARGELPALGCEVSVLTEPQPLPFAHPRELLEKLRPGVDGVVLQARGRSATFLPQVWEQLPEPVEFLSRLALKAGLEADDWRLPGTAVMTYQVEAFSDAA